MIWAGFGGIFMFLAVALGAFGAHALKNSLSSDRLGVFETAVRYQTVHALALFACAWVHQSWPSRVALAAGACFVAGAVLFCGSLYLLVLLDQPRFGIATPFGGIAFLAGWLLLTAAIVRSGKPAG